MSSRILIGKEKYCRLLDSSGNAIRSTGGALNTTASVTIENVDVSGTVIIRGTTVTSEGRLPTDVSGSVTLTGASVMSTNVVSSVTTVWNNEVFGDTSTSAVHNGTYHGKYNVFGSVSSSCTLELEFSDTSATWYRTHHVIMIGTDGIIDGAFDDVVVPYIRLRKVGAGDVCGTVLICGKGV